MAQAQTSLTSLTLKYMLFIFGIVFLVSYLSFIVLKSYMQEQYVSMQINNIQVKANEISEVIRYYRDIVKQLSHQKKVKDIAQFGDKKEAVAWAKNMQNLLPLNIGLAILDSDGEILGEPPDLRVGDLCMEDLNSFYRNETITRPSVHKQIKKWEHFDIIQSITDNGEKVGILFASFSLNIIQNKLNNIIEKGQKLTVISSDGQQVASAEKFKQNALLKKEIVIPDSDWVLYAEIEQHDLSQIWTVILLANMLIYLAVSISIYLFVKKIHAVFKKDFSLITNLLRSLKSRHELPEKIQPAICMETQNLVSSVVGIAEEIAYYQKELLNSSNSDELTGLPNRRFFQAYAEKQIAQAERNNDDLALLYIDLDGFKMVNDTAGHTTGDQVLQIMAERFKRFLRKNELIARLGGDEFCLLIYGNIDEFEINNLTKRLKNECMQKIVLDGKTFTLDVSLGIAIFPDDGTSYDGLISCADQRMYADKKHKK